MWGYIVTPYHLPQKCVVPSLYVRVYLLQIGKAGDTIRSLIICEGISVLESLPQVLSRFPHYMWGYIGMARRKGHRRKVPSLYVRVYRKWGLAVTFLACSLIICEGISSTRQIAEEFKVFPHYMWGYIRYPHFWGLMNIVPSLYVRVYRSDLLRLWFQNRSLIICEGISVLCISHNSEAAFPHYMWGYICYTSIW